MKYFFIVLVIFFSFSNMAESILKNNDFFQRNNQDEPTQWDIRYSEKTMEKEKLVSVTNNILSLGGPTLKGEILLIQPNIPLVGNKKYKVTYESKSLYSSGNLRIYLQYQVINSENSPVSINANWKKTTTEWSSNEFYFEYPDTARSPWFVINISGDKLVQIKNVVIEEIK